MKLFKVFTLFIYILLLSCAKDEKLFIPDQTYVINRDALMANLVDTPKKYRLNITDAPLLFNYEFGYLILPADALSDESGAPVRGEVEMTFLVNATNKPSYLYCPSMIYNDHVFESTYMVFVKITQSGKPLKLSTAADLYLKDNSGGNDISDKFLFKGTIEQDEQISWTIDDNQASKLAVDDWKINYLESTINVKGYKLSIGVLDNWYAIGSTDDTKPKINASICASMNKEFSVKNTLVYFISEKSNIVFQLSKDAGHSWSFCGTDIVLPLNLSGNIVAISDFGSGGYYFGSIKVVLTEKKEVFIDSELMSKEKIKEVLKTL